MNIPFEHWRTCEWAIKSIQAYKDIHFKEINANPSKDYDLDFLINYLFKKGISSNYNEPMKKEQIKKLGEKQIRNIYNNIQITNNLVNIQQVVGEELNIVDKDKYTYLLTYSFPCQDLSLAGKGRGMADTSTRSGMLWEVERILDDCKILNQLPDILLMENVPQVHSQENLDDFNKWKYKLETLGYKNYFQDLIGTDYGIPQTRNRCFMVSILGDYSYTFPKPIPLKLKLKDMLEDKVDEKYYLSDKNIEYICGNAIKKELKDVINRENAIFNKKEAYTITTKIDRRIGDVNYIIDNFDEELKVKDFLKIRENTKKGYAIAYDGDGVYINRPHQKRGVVQKDKIQTLKTSVDDIGVVVNEPKVIGGFGNKCNNGTQYHLQNRIYEGDRAITITTCCNPYYVVGTYQYSKSDKFMKGKDILQLNKEVSDTLQTHQKEGIVYNNLRIRKLTPKECGRLMGVKDEDIEKLTLSDSAKYHCFGDSIIVDVLMAIFKEMI